MLNTNSKTKKSLPWDEVEDAIKKEVDWLRQVIDTFSDKEDIIGGIPGIHYCRECLIRRIAILILSGKIKAKQMNRKDPLKSFWLAEKKDKKGVKIHGEEWHSQTMNQIEDHFIKQKYEVTREPNLHWGRADLGVYKKGKPTIFIEVGTTSFAKLWLNLATEEKFVYLIVPDDDKLVEFSKVESKQDKKSPF